MKYIPVEKCETCRSGAQRRHRQSGGEMKSVKRWMLFDPDGNPWGWTALTRREAVEAKVWNEPSLFFQSALAWEDAKKAGWTVKKVTIMEGWGDNDQCGWGIFQEARRRSCSVAFDDPSDHLETLLADAHNLWPNGYSTPKGKELLLDLAAQIIRVLEGE